jgi:tape measure domain-containing protein
MAQVGKATVAFEADTSQVTGELSSSMQTALKEVSRAVETTMTKVEGDFSGAGGALADGVEDGGAKATKSAESSSGKISGAFERAAAEASAALDNVDGDGFSGVASQASNAASSVQSSISDAAARAGAALDGVDGDAFNDVAADATRASSTIGSRIPEAARKAKESIQDIGRNAKKTWDDAETGAFNFMGTLGKVAGAAAALAGPAVIVQKGWARLTSIDEARAKLGALGNSAQDIELIMDNAMESVTGTAFGFGDAAGQAATLVAAGIEPGEDLQRILGLVADSASVAGVDLNEMGSIFGKVAASGKLQGEELAQLLDRQLGLLPVLSEQYGVSSDEMRKMISDGKVGFEDFAGAMETMVGGGAEAMGSTVRASFANVGAAAGRLGEALLMPIFQAAPGFLAGITAGLGVATDAVKDVIAWFEEGSLAADLLKASLIGVGSAAVIGVLVGNLGKLQGAMTAVLGALKALNAGFLLTGPGIAIAAVVAVIAAFVLLWQHSEGFRDFWIGLWDSIMTAVQPAVDFVQEKFELIRAAWNELTAAFTGGDDGYGALWDLIGGDNAETLINKVASVGETLRDLWDLVQGVGDILFRGDFTSMPFGIEEDSPIVGILFTVRDAVIGVWDALKGAGEAIGSSIWQTMVSVFEAFVSIGQAVWEAFKAIAGAVWNLIQALAPILLPILKVVGAILGGVILGAIFLVIGALRAMAWIWQMVAKVIEVFANVISWLVQNILSPLIQIVAKVAAVLINVLAGAFTWLGEKVSAFIEWVGPALSSFWDGITEAWSTATAWLGEVFTSLWEGLQTAWETVGQPVVDFVVAAFTMLWESIQLIGRLIGATFEVLFTALGKAWEAWGQPVVDWVVLAFQWMGDKIRLGFDLLVAGWNVLWGFMQLAWQTVGQPIIDGIVWAFQSFWNGLNIIFGWVRTGWEMLWNGLRAVYDTVIAPVIGWIVDKFNYLRAMIDYALRFVRAYIDLAAFKVRSFWHEYVQPMIDNVVDGFNRMLDKIKGWKDNVIGWFSDAGSWLVDSGKNIVQGLIDGATSLLSRMGEFFLNALPGWVKDPFKKALGIHSPSRVFAEYGQNIGQGLVNGVQSMSEQVRSATGDLAQGAQAGFDASTITPVINTPEGSSAPPMAPLGVDLGASAMASTFPAQVDGVIAPAVEHMGAVITGAKEETIDPALVGIAEHMTGVGNSFLLNTAEVINPAVTGMGMHLANTRATVIDPTMWGIESHLATMSGNFVGNIGIMINPAVSSMGTHLNNVKVGIIDPAFAGIRSGLSYVVGAFANGARDVGIHMQTMRRNTADPVRFTMNTVFSDGLVEMWNGVSDLIGTKKMAKKYASFATGGVIPGPYTPGRDTQRYFNPASGHVLDLSGGEPVLRPEVGRALGSDWVHGINSAARMEGEKGVSRFLAHTQLASGGYIPQTPVFGGSVSNIGRSHEAFIERFFPGIFRLTSATRPTADNHGSGRATDWQDRNGQAATQMPTANSKALARAIAKSVPNSLELIHWPLDGWQNIKNGRPASYDAGTNAQHANHVHWATAGPIGAVGGLDSVDINWDVDWGAMLREMVSEDLNRVNSAVAGFRSPGFAGQIPSKTWTAMREPAFKAMEKALEESMKSVGAGGGAQRWRGLAMQALARHGYNPADHIEAMLQQIQIESGGDPGAINRWDSNWLRGTPSGGLLQVIEPTYRRIRNSYPEAFKGLPDDHMFPLTNLTAGVGAVRQDWGGPAGRWPTKDGYHAGGLLPEGMGMFAKTALGRERVLSPRQTSAFEDLVATLDRANMPRIAPASERGEGTGGSLRTREVHVTQNIYSNDAKGAADRASDRLTSLII